EYFAWIHAISSSLLPELPAEKRMSTGVRLLDDGEGGDAVIDARPLALPAGRGREEVGDLERPGPVALGPFPDRGRGRPHLGEHLVEREPLHAVAAAQAGDLQLCGAVGDLEGEEVLPFGPRGMQPGKTTRAGTEGEEGVVLDVRLPEVGPALREGEVDVAGEVAGEVDEVDPLVDELAPARGLPAGPPLLLVAGPAPVAVATTDVHQVAVGLLCRDLPGLQQRRMEAVVEADLDDPARCPRGSSHGHEVLQTMRPRLLHEHMASGIECREGC